MVVSTMEQNMHGKSGTCSQRFFVDWSNKPFSFVIIPYCWAHFNHEIHRIGSESHVRPFGFDNS